MTICYTDRTINGNMTITQILDVSGNASLNNVTVNSLSGNLIGNVTGYVTGTVSSLSNHNTDDLAEGSHKYYDDSLVNTYLEGGSHVGVTFNNGAMSIGQSVRPDNSPTFKAMTLTDVNDASYGLIDFKHDYGAVATSFPPITGIYTMAQIKGNIESGGNGGELSFHTKANNGVLQESLRIANTGTGNSNTNFDNKTLLAMNGMLKLERNDAGATSKDTYIYNSMDSTNVDLNIETRTDMGISFMAEGTTRMRISDGGNVGIGTTTPTAKLDVSGSITGGHATLDSLSTQGGSLTAGTTVVRSLDVRDPTYSPTNPLSYGYITGGVTSVTELKTNTIYPATGQVNTTFPYDVYCRDMNVNEKLVTDRITAPGTTINIDKKLNVTDTLRVEAEFRCQNGDGTITHFNNGNGNKNYIRGTDTYCDTHFRMDTNKYILFGNLQAWFLQSGVIWFNLLYAYTHNGSQQIQNELNFGFNSPTSSGSWAKLWTITGNKIHYRRPLQNSSDDRLKHNETDIVKGLNIIRQLQPEKYQKTVEMYEADYNGVIDEPAVWEAGLIAQKILQIPELTDYVAGGDEISESGETIANAYSLDYNSISMYGLAAIKELDTIVQAQQSKIDSLEAENTLMKSKLNEILTEMGKETILD